MIVIVRMKLFMEKRKKKLKRKMSGFYIKVLISKFRKRYLSQLYLKITLIYIIID